MKTNVGGTDRILRALIGVALVLGFFALPDLGWRWVLPVLGAVAIFTAILRTCPLYSILGLNTCPLNK
ncbi:DUF2892 domain-containing protein [Pseudorhodobacter sp.]|uniref:YgaP family membrane protein n=1 Tax=Pseudorhodobacter sp. TaxID=1934400 RepID=UPI002647DD9D|nr:DUF2892 domain-containing protein [Pseudorhodobacter sp.]MDN5788395.1 DUF2892 domain-containing protein [Pseudorhodobacter sp.]